ncbi:hypothetical protein C8Q77DRAFT_596058 [Trametes polyzona]|nr:hypothetical protein C8Q77DRAFT_596058 [Trametes polyzona]
MSRLTALSSTSRILDGVSHRGAARLMLRANSTCASVPVLSVTRPTCATTSAASLFRRRSKLVLRNTMLDLQPIRMLSHDSVSSVLPEHPPTPPYPCPFLTTEEIETYLGPLYVRAWSVHRSDPGPKNKPAPELVKRFTFSTPDKLGAFLRDLAEITERENHHAVQEVSHDPPSVVIKVHTHYGLRPARSADEPRRVRVQPGITLRDVRFAYLVEHAFSEYVARREAGNATMMSSPSPEEQPRTAEALEARRGESGGV